MMEEEEWTKDEHVLKIPRTDPLLDSPRIQILHQLHKARLRFLVLHGGALDGADFLLRFGLLRLRQRVDVVEDVGRFGYTQGGSAKILGLKS